MSDPSAPGHQSPTLADKAKSLCGADDDSRATEVWTAVDTIYNRLADSGRQFGDGAILLREDRDR
jgi:hypothetical protein